VFCDLFTRKRHQGQEHGELAIHQSQLPHGLRHGIRTPPLLGASVSTVTPGVLNRLPHHRGEPRRADRVGRDPETAGRGAAVKLPGVDDKPKHEMSEDLLHLSRHPPPL